jgi:predicted lactoylglutathione lyase
MEMRIHISLEVSDLKKSIQFYEGLFGREATKVQSDYANFRMENPNLHLALVNAPQRELESQSSNRHYGIELFSKGTLSEWQKSAQNAGLSLRIEEQVTCCYAVADKFWARDPDGHNWEFWVRSSDTETKDSIPAVAQPSKSQCCAPGQC